MSREQAEKLMLAIDGLRANLETIRALIESFVEEEIVPTAPISVDGVCSHANTRSISTHGGEVNLCDDCGVML